MKKRFRCHSLLLLLTTITTASSLNAALPPPCSTSFSPAFLANTISAADWDEIAVRKILHAYAYGGFATDQQIQIWSGMSPDCAVQEILTFDPTNDLLSQPGADPLYDSLEQNLTTADGDATLAALQTFWSSSDALNPASNSAAFNLLNDNGSFKISALQNTWIETTNKRGVNTFRQKVGFWLTNYHMSVHMQAVDNNPAIIRKMYDDVMRVLANDLEGDDVNYFSNVLAEGAMSPALAVQYGHNVSRYSGTAFIGNDDFAREFYQLFFGVLGEDDKDDYENVTIESMARILTGMAVDRSNTYYAENSGTTLFSYFHDVLAFDLAKHYPDSLGDLVTLGTSISSASYPTAMDKIDEASQIAINNLESEDNLPVWIVTHFADDTLNSENDTDLKVIDIRDAWKNSNKNLLHFLRSYAISDQFHQTGNFQTAQRYKYRSAFDRNMLAYNKNTVDNKESYLNTNASPRVRMESQGAKTFYPSHFVFGGQTGVEAANNPDIFKEAYNANVINPGLLANESNSSTGWSKEWSKLVPSTFSDGNGNYRVGDISSWFWNRFIADGGENFGLEERFYVAGLMAQGNSFDPLDGYSRNELDPNDPEANPQAIQLLTDYENTMISIDSNKNIGLAINFITVTPYMFVQLGNDMGGQ